MGSPGHIQSIPNDSLDDWIDKAVETDVPTLNDGDFDDEPRGPPLSDNEIDDGLRLLARWQSPDDIKKMTDALCWRCQSSDYFNRPQLNFLQDAYVLAKFARLKEAESVRLAAPSERWPDGLMKLEGQIYNIEVTSTHGGRKLGQEYRNVSGPTLDPVENWVARADSIPKYLDDAISTKPRRTTAAPVG